MAKLNIHKLKSEFEENNAYELIDLFCSSDLTDAADCSDKYELREWLNGRIIEAEITYYSEAMKYLTEHDNSLRIALSLAENYGYHISKLNSETLATLVYQDNLMEELATLDLEACFEEEEAPEEEEDDDYDE